MTRHEVTVEVLGPWSLDTSKRFWEGFAPDALPSQRVPHEMWTVFRVEGDWGRAEVRVAQQGNAARIVVTGDGDLDRAAAQSCRFLSLDVDARRWPDVALRDQVIADAQVRLPGLRPCGFHSPYEAAAWAVLSQRLRIVQASRLRDDLVRHHGQDGAFPPQTCCAPSTSTCPAAKPSTCTPSPMPHWTASSTETRSARWTPTTPCAPCSR